MDGGSYGHACVRNPSILVCLCKGSGLLHLWSIWLQAVLRYLGSTANDTAGPQEIGAKGPAAKAAPSTPACAGQLIACKPPALQDPQ